MAGVRKAAPKPATPAKKAAPKRKPTTAANAKSATTKRPRAIAPAEPVATTVTAPPPPVPVAPQPYVAPVAPKPAPSNGLAMAALISGLSGFTFVPVLGGLAACVLGAVAIRRERMHPDRYTGRGMAMAGMILGFFTGIVPLLIVTLFASADITPIPFVAVAAFAAYVFITATQGRSAGQKVAIIGGSLVTTAVAVALAIGLAFGFYYLMRYISIEIGRAIGDAFSQMFDGIGDAFGSCSSSIDV